MVPMPPQLMVIELKSFMVPAVSRAQSLSNFVKG